MPEKRLAELVALACHDLRTPLAAISGVAKMLLGQGTLSAQDSQLVEIIDASGAEMAGLLDLLGRAARIAAGRYAPPLRPTTTRALAASSDGRVLVEGRGARVTTDVESLSAALAALASAALCYGEVGQVRWALAGRSLLLTPLGDEAAAVVSGARPRDLGALVAGRVIEALGGELALEDGGLRVRLA